MNFRIIAFNSVVGENTVRYIINSTVVINGTTVTIIGCVFPEGATKEIINGPTIVNGSTTTNHRRSRIISSEGTISYTKGTGTVDSTTNICSCVGKSQVKKSHGSLWPDFEYPAGSFTIDYGVVLTFTGNGHTSGDCEVGVSGSGVYSLGNVHCSVFINTANSFIYSQERTICSSQICVASTSGINIYG